MGIDGSACELQNSDMIQQGWAISLHAYADLRNVSPAVFLFLLKECYVHGKAFFISIIHYFLLAVILIAWLTNSFAILLHVYLI